MDSRKGFSCLSGMLDVMLPVGFERPSDEMAVRKFPYRQRPQEIFMDSTGEQVITFNLLEKQLAKKQVYVATCEIERLIRHAYPESICRRACCTYAADILVGYFSFITGGLLDDQLHIMFIFPLLQQMMLGSCHFPKRYGEQGELIFHQLIKDMQIKRKPPEPEGHWGNKGKYAGIRV